MTIHGISYNVVQDACAVEAALANAQLLSGRLSRDRVGTARDEFSRLQRNVERLGLELDRIAGGGRQHEGEDC